MQLKPGDKVYYTLYGERIERVVSYINGPMTRLTNGNWCSTSQLRLIEKSKRGFGSFVQRMGL